MSLCQTTSGTQILPDTPRLFTLSETDSVDSWQRSEFEADV
ncbi:hypothetical protein N9087_01070 [bacterium]|nr:hypothetical protein [bacterium]